MQLGGSTVSMTFGVTQVILNRRNQDDDGIKYFYKDATHQLILTVRRSNSKTKTPNGTEQFNDRHNVELIETIFATESAVEQVRKAYYIIEQKPSDVDVDNIDALCDATIENSQELVVDLFAWKN